MKRLLCVALLCGLAGCSAVNTAPTVAPSTPPSASGLSDGIYAEITTPRGVILCELYYRQVPLTVTNFVGLAEGRLGPAPRKPYFDGQTFHRVVPGFVVQGGDPTGTGRGGPGYRFPDEFAAGLRHDVPGVLSMANSGPDTNGSQFFITLGEARYLDYVHSIFGRVVRGQDIIARIERDDAMTVKIIRQGRDAQRFQADDAAFAQRLARASRFVPPHFVDSTGLGAGSEHWQARYIEHRLSNLARFTGRQIFVRLLADFEPDPPGQSLEQAVQEMPANLNLPPGSLLAVYVAAQDRWLLAGAPTGVTLGQLPPPTPPRVSATTPDAVARQKQTQLYKTTGQVVSYLIDQTDPK